MAPHLLLKPFATMQAGPYTKTICGLHGRVSMQVFESELRVTNIPV
jgi:hypothetical protein